MSVHLAMKFHSIAAYILIIFQILGISIEAQGLVICPILGKPVKEEVPCCCEAVGSSGNLQIKEYAAIMQPDCRIPVKQQLPGIITSNEEKKRDFRYEVNLMTYVNSLALFILNTTYSLSTPIKYFSYGTAIFLLKCSFLC